MISNQLKKIRLESRERLVEWGCTQEEIGLVEEYNLHYHERLVKSKNAHAAIRVAISKGTIERPDTCELCGDKPKPITFKTCYGPQTRPEIYAHHWNGYDDRLNVWWVCQQCNARLAGEEYHIGRVTKEEAREIVNQAPKEPPVAKQCIATVRETGERCKKNTFTGDYCVSHLRAKR